VHIEVESQQISRDDSIEFLKNNMLILLRRWWSYKSQLSHKGGPEWRRAQACTGRVIAVAETRGVGSQQRPTTVSSLQPGILQVRKRYMKDGKYSAQPPQQSSL
jgi:hypothetical protein